MHSMADLSTKHDSLSPTYIPRYLYLTSVHATFTGAKPASLDWKQHIHVTEAELQRGKGLNHALSVGL